MFFFIVGAAFVAVVLVITASVFVAMIQSFSNPSPSPCPSSFFLPALLPLSSPQYACSPSTSRGTSYEWDESYTFVVCCRNELYHLQVFFYFSLSLSVTKKKKKKTYSLTLLPFPFPLLFFPSFLF